jgi:uroporphyrinogen III methyltransferase / synthase
MITKQGKVYLMGAGPGDPGLMTVRSQQILTEAEVIIYDALADIPPVPLRENCLKLEVGKRGGQPSKSQEEINHLLVKYCQEGKQVIRLKSGDPFVFGRGTSEIQALKERGCDWDVIPGISTALVAPLLAGIPLTDPVMSRCFAVMSGHDPDALAWEALAQLETLVILMGGKTLPDIIHQLILHNRSRDTPIAIIRNSSRPNEKIWIGNLGNILNITAGESLSPSVIIIGEVVKLHDYLIKEEGRRKKEEGIDEREINGSQLKSLTDKKSMLYPEKPLTGKTILVTRAAGQSSQFRDRLLEEGAQVIEMPALVIGAPSSWESLDQALSELSSFHWLILTSTNGVDYFFERLFAQGKDTRALANLKIAVVGKKTSERLKSRGINPDFIPPNFVADSLIENFPDPLEGSKILFPRVESGGREVLVKEFTAKGAQVVEVSAYQSRCPDTIAPEALEALKNHRVNVITFASSKTVQNFCQLVSAIRPSELSHNWLDEICIASIGPETTKTCKIQLGRCDLEAQEYTIDGLIDAIVQWAQ